MAEPIHFAVRHPRRLGFILTPDGDLMLTARAGRDCIEIVASRDRWAELVREAMTGHVRDPARIARDMFVRDEIDVTELERALDGHS